MGQNLRDRSEVCPLPPGPLKDLSLHHRPYPILVAVSLSIILMASGLVYYWMPPPYVPLGEPEVYTAHGSITIDGDANFSATAAREGWSGDGSPGNPYIIDGLEIARMSWLGMEYEGSCIDISNTRVSFIVSNCNLTGANNHQIGIVGAGISLVNVSSGLLVNNNIHNNEVGILIANSYSNTVMNNTCKEGGETILSRSNNNFVTNNTYCSTFRSITLAESDSNTVANNTCSSSEEEGILLHNSHFNTVANNTCSSSEEEGILLHNSHSNTVVNNNCSSNGFDGIRIIESDSNTIANNICNSNDIGIALYESRYNTIMTNTCNDNRIGIELVGEPYSNVVDDNTFMGNTEYDIVGEYRTEEDRVFLSVGFGLAGIIMLGAAWRMLSGMREFNKE